MNAVENQVRELVGVELASANKQFPQFHSPHEGWAVMREEWEEAAKELSSVAAEMNAMWEYVKQDDIPDARVRAHHVQADALAVMKEAAQLAAMARKMIDYCNEVLCE